MASIPSDPLASIPSDPLMYDISNSVVKTLFHKHVLRRRNAFLAKLPEDTKALSEEKRVDQILKSEVEDHKKMIYGVITHFDLDFITPPIEVSKGGFQQRGLIVSESNPVYKQIKTVGWQGLNSSSPLLKFLSTTKT
jgi:hypothetical protein